MTRNAFRISLGWFYAPATRAARQRCDVDAPREYSSDAITRLGTGLNDLGIILALPAVWAGAEPSEIVSTLVDTASPSGYKELGSAHVIEARAFTAPVFANSRVYVRNTVGDVVSLDLSGK